MLSFSLLPTSECSLILAQLRGRFVTIPRREFWGLQGLPLRDYRFFNLARPKICKGKNSQVRRVLHVEGNRVFHESDSLFGIAVCRIWTVHINTCCLVVELSPKRFEVGRFFKICRSLWAGLHGSERSATAQE